MSAPGVAPPRGADGRGARLVVLLAAGLAWAVVPALALLGGFDHDEVEHVGVAWRIASGEVPYRDFHQNHLPAFWYALVPFVAAFKGTLLPLYLGRLMSAAATVAAALLGLRLVGRLCGEGAVNRGIYLLFFIALAPKLQLFWARPDPLMAALAAAALCAQAGAASLSSRSALLSGLLLGLSASVSTKMALLTLVFPAALLVAHSGVAVAARLRALALHALGFALGLAPLALFVTRHGLWRDLAVNVWETNRFLSRTAETGWAFTVQTPFALCAIAGAVLLAGLRGAPRERKALLFTIPAWALAGYATLSLSMHGGFYNLGLVAVPQALLLTLALSLLLGRIARPGARLAALGAAAVLVAALVARPISTGAAPGDQIGRDALRRIVREHGDGLQTCIGMAPYHPIYCRNVSPIQLLWDLRFAKTLKGTPPGERFQRYWGEAMRAALTGEVDFIVRAVGSRDPWRQVQRLGAFSEQEFERFKAMKTRYDEVRVGAARVWIRKR